MKQQIELSERLRLACLEKGISEPRFVAQDEDGKWAHYNKTPQRDNIEWFDADNPRIILHEQPNENWRETLMEFITPKIEVGKRYWRRDGSVSPIIQYEPQYGYNDGKWLYTESGLHNALDSLRYNEIDLIAEYREELPIPATHDDKQDAFQHQEGDDSGNAPTMP